MYAQAAAAAVTAVAAAHEGIVGRQREANNDCNGSGMSREVCHHLAYSSAFLPTLARPYFVHD